MSEGHEFKPLHIFGESHLLAAALPAFLFPGFAFIGACIQVRYKEEYVKCLATEKVKLEEDQLLTNLRMIQCAFFAYSLSYFFLITIPSNARLTNLINITAFTSLNLLVLAIAIYGSIITGNSKCAGSENGYGPVLWFMNISGIILVIIELIFAMYLYFGFKKSKTVPLFSDSKSNAVAAANAKNDDSQQ